MPQGVEMAGEKILIVEDEVRVAQTLQSALTASDENRFQVQVCHSGEEALTLLRKTKFDLLVTDLRMPGISGLDLVEQVRATSPGTRCILITAYGTAQVEERAAQLDVDAFLKKPFNMQSFVETVKHTMVENPMQRQMAMFSEQGMRNIHKRIEQLRADVGGLGVMLLDPSGQLINESGQRGKFDVNTFLALLANTMAAVDELSRVMQDPDAFNLHFQEGKNYETYTARVSDQVLLCLILEKAGTSSRIGMVWLYLRRAISELRDLFVKAVIADSHPGLDRDVVSALQNALDGVMDGLDSLGGESTPAPAFAPEPQVPPEPQPIKATPKPATTRRTIAELFDTPSRRAATASDPTFKPMPKPIAKPAPEPEPAPKPVAKSVPAPDPVPPDPEPAHPDLPDGVDDKTVLSFEEAVRLGLIKLDNAEPDEDKQKKK
jgi:CheY-like chemotaxis protein